ncbi:hypothetical protein MBLNU459_g6993t1 [Dothideomycetes sp. NU459]
MAEMHRTDSAQQGVHKDESIKSASAVEERVAFQDLDNPYVLADSMRALAHPLSRNVVVEFGDEEARVAFDLEAEYIQVLLDTDEQSNALNTRWINVWYPYHQRSVLELLAQRYDFSPRLLGLMCSDPHRPRAADRLSSRSGARSSYMVATMREASLSDVESRGESPTELASLASNNPARTGNLYDIVDDVWHYTSVDQGRSYVCLGYNSLYNTGLIDAENGVREDSSSQPLPHVKRVWTWLLLCDDRTIITINEDPFPYSEGRLSRAELCVLADCRRNLCNVFRSLSKVEDPRSASPLTLLPIRRRLGDTREETAHRDSDAPGLLFYYLFENWFNSYSLVTRRESRFGIELNRVRAEMFQKPQLRHIDRLDAIGNELGVLKRHYKAYLRIIERVIEPQQATPTSLANSQVASKASKQSLNAQNDVKVTEAESLLGVGLSSAARVRFERLKDMINLYALSETKDYLKERDGLVQMNFQLIANRQSRDVERLTRVALLISKATILFLPVSFMTAYFSVDTGITYTIRTYWVSFSVVLFSSWIVLFGFGVMSGTMERWTFFPPLRKAVSVVRHVMGKSGLRDHKVASAGANERG